MDLKLRICAACTALGLLMLFAGCPATDTTDQAETPADSDAGSQLAAVPVASFTDAEGNTVSLADFAGKPLVVNFWAVW